jgi:hypothetical protein
MSRKKIELVPSKYNPDAALLDRTSTSKGKDMG